jgi:dTDP-4-dehydrorhamnose reductase
VAADQVGCPTAAPDLAAAILAIADRVLAGGWDDAWNGIYHACGSGATSWYGLASAAFEAAAERGPRPPTLTPIATADWPTPARRPPDSRLDCGKLDRVFGVRLPEWRVGLSRVVECVAF